MSGVTGNLQRDRDSGMTSQQGAQGAQANYFRLYVSGRGDTCGRSADGVANALSGLLGESNYKLEVYDVTQQPDRAEAD